MTLQNLQIRCGSPLTERKNTGVYVALFYDRNSEEAFVYYQDDHRSYSLDAPKDNCLDVYYHPNAYAAAAINGRYSLVAS